MDPTEPVLTERGEQARDLLAARGTVTAAEALALAVLEGRINPPKGSAQGALDG
jgi:hypothetical protein